MSQWLDDVARLNQEARCAVEGRWCRYASRVRRGGRVREGVVKVAVRRDWRRRKKLADAGQSIGRRDRMIKRGRGSVAEAQIAASSRGVRRRDGIVPEVEFSCNNAGSAVGGERERLVVSGGAEGRERSGERGGRGEF